MNLFGPKGVLVTEGPALPDSAVPTLVVMTAAGLKAVAVDMAAAIEKEGAEPEADGVEVTLDNTLEPAEATEEKLPSPLPTRDKGGGTGRPMLACLECVALAVGVDGASVAGGVGAGAGMLTTASTPSPVTVGFNPPSPAWGTADTASEEARAAAAAAASCSFSIWARTAR